MRRSSTFVLSDYFTLDRDAPPSVQRRGRLSAKRALYHHLGVNAVRSPKALTGGAREWESRRVHAYMSWLKGMDKRLRR